MTGAIDIVCAPATPKDIRLGRVGLDERAMTQLRMPPKYRKGVPMKDYVGMMDEANIDRSLLIAVRGGDMRKEYSFEVPYEAVHETCEKYPDRFSGLAGIDPTRGMQGLRDLEYAVTKLGFVGAHIYPHWIELAPDAAQYYPYYAKCCELDIPIMMQVGHNLIYQKERRLATLQRPILLDRVAIDFPDLKIIGIHIGIPWTDEMISMCWKHENVYICGDAYAPKHWPKQFVHYANTYGQDKVLFGTDWPAIAPKRFVDEINALGMRPESLRKMMRENALKVFTKLPEAKAAQRKAAKMAGAKKRGR